MHDPGRAVAPRPDLSPPPSPYDLADIFGGGPRDPAGAPLSRKRRGQPRIADRVMGFADHPDVGPDAQANSGSASSRTPGGTEPSKPWPFDPLIPPEEGEQKYREIQALTTDPDFAGLNTWSRRITTSAGPGLARLPHSAISFGGYDMRMLPEAEALRFAHASGARVPEPIYVGRGVVIERFVDGVGPSFDGDWQAWHTDMLEQVKLVHAHRPPGAPISDVFEFQMYSKIFFDQLYAGLAGPRLREIQLPPLQALWRPDPALSGRRIALVHADLHPGNLLIDDGKVTIIDWELAIVGDPIWDAAVALHRTSWPNPAVEEYATTEWLRMLEAGGHVGSDPAARLHEYRGIEIWKSLLVDSEKFPRAVAANPALLDFFAHLYHDRLAEGAQRFGTVNLPFAAVRELLLRWSTEPGRFPL